MTPPRLLALGPLAGLLLGLALVGGCAQNPVRPEVAVRVRTPGSAAAPPDRERGASMGKEGSVEPSAKPADSQAEPPRLEGTLQ